MREAVTHEEIARRAYALWEWEGCQHGRDKEYWLEAERQLHGTPSLLGLPKSDETEVDAREQARAIKASAERRASLQQGVN